MKYIKYTFILVLVIGTVFILGPKKEFEPAELLDTEIQVSLADLEKYVAEKEATIKDLKPDNQARIIWADDSLKQKTEYAVVYLHGFSASQEEGAPLHEDFAKRYGLNLYLSRLEDHGRPDSNSFIQLTPENFLQSAEDAIDIGKKLGDKVIVMSCSTGGTLSAILAAAGEDIHSMIMYSPNIDIYDPMSALLVYPWAEELSTLVMGGTYNRIVYDTLAQKYWNSIYHTNALFTIKTLIRDYMTEENFAKIQIPVFVGYYYKDEENQDKVVSVARMLDFYDQISTPDSLKRKMAFPEAGKHVISSHVMSKDIEGVFSETCKWAEEVLHLKPVK
jgi:esterase/lipase